MKHTFLQKNIRMVNALGMVFGKPVFSLLLAVCVGAALVYMYFIVGITANIVARKGYEQNKKSIETDISTLELAYLNKMQALDVSATAEYGLARPKEIYFASRESRVGLLSHQ